MFTANGIIMGVIMTTILGGFLTLIILSSDLKIIPKIFISLFLCGLIFVFSAAAYDNQEYNWNNGRCIECGTKYECVGKARMTDEYYYCCPNCFHKANHY